MATASDNAKRKRRMERRKKRKESMRPHYNLYLNKARDDHRAAAAVIEHLISRRKFLPVAVMAVRLVEELERGEIGLLMQHYSWVADRIKSSMTIPEPPDFGRLEKRFDHLEQVVLSSGRVGSSNGKNMSSESLDGHGNLSGAHALPMPIVDDDDTVVLKRDTHTDAGANFMAAALGIQHS